MWLKSNLLVLAIAVFGLLLLGVGLSLFKLQLDRDFDILRAPRTALRLPSRRAIFHITSEPPKLIRIPRQLVLTAKYASLDRVPSLVQKNIQQTLDLNPGFTMRLLGDAECKKYFKEHYNRSKLLLLFEEETRGSYRSDMCRAAVLAREGGFYTDLDVEMKVNFETLAGNATFLASYSEDRSVLNAMLGAVPGSAFMQDLLEMIVLYKTGGMPPFGWDTTSEWMGPTTARAALKAVAERDCPKQELEDPSQCEFSCGSHVVRMFQERSLDCFEPSPSCEGIRFNSDFQGVKFGIFQPDGELVAWPRFAACTTWGCETGGWPSEEPSEAREDAPAGWDVGDGFMS